jgi:uncharacterized membrane protein
MLGILLELVSATLSAVGTILQKEGLQKIKKWKDVLKSRRWILGYAILYSSFIFYVLALKYERLSVIQPIGNFSIIALVILEFVFLKERLKTKEIIALILFFSGILLVWL